MAGEFRRFYSEIPWEFLDRIKDYLKGEPREAEES